jgi:hypothetical protein
MAKLSIVAGATSQTVNIFIQDSSSTTGAGLTGLAFNTASLVAYYALSKAAAVQITLATLAAITTAWSSGGFKEVDATNMPGWYRLDLPDAALASGRFVAVHLKGATNMAPLPLEIELTAVNNQDAVHGGMSCLPNTAVTTNASLLTSGAGTDQLAVASGRIDAGKILGTAISTPATAGILDVNVKNMNNVAGSGITAVNANQGTTQPLNFTGTAGSALVKSDMVDVAGAAVSTAAAQIGVNAVNLGGTAQTGRDIGASVLLSPGVGAGQIDLTAGIPKANTTQLAGQTVTAAAGVTFPTSVASPTNITAGTISTATSVTAIGAGGIASASFAAGAVDAAAIATDAITSAELAASAATKITTAVWAQLMSELAAVPAVTDSVLAALEWLFLQSRNKITQTATTQLLRNNADNATIGTSTVSDDATTFIRGVFS